MYTVYLHFLLRVETRSQYPGSVENLQFLGVARMELEVSGLGESVLENHTLLALCLILRYGDVVDLADLEFFVFMIARPMRRLFGLRRLLVRIQTRCASRGRFFL